MTLLVLPQPSPYLLGVYDKEGRLVASYEEEGKISDTLTERLARVLNEYAIESIVYTNGPGSHMATKIAYVTLQTAALVRGLSLYGCSLFDVNGGLPVKAIGALYFVKEKETIITKKLPPPVKTDVVLPSRLNIKAVKGSALPDYQLPAV